MTIYTLRCRITGETSTYIVCERCAHDMPATDGENVTAAPADDDAKCEDGTRCSDAPDDGGGAWERRLLGIC